MAQVLAHRLANVGVNEVELHPDNPRRGDLSVITESIEANGFFGAIIVDEQTNYVLVGNHRLEAARLAGITEVPAILINPDPETAKRILIADNRTSELAVWDEEVLAALLTSLDGELLGTGFSEDALAKLIAAPPASFPSADEDLATEHRCPKCGYEWSGRPAP